MLSLSTGSTIGEKLTMQPDPDGLKFGDKHSVAVMKDGMTVGDLPKDTFCSSLYTGEQLNAKAAERKKTFKRCCVAVWRCPNLI